MSGSDGTALHREVQEAYDFWIESVEQHSREGLERIHHPDFLYTGVDGQLLDRDQHIELELVADVEQEIDDLLVHPVGDYVLSWGKHSLHGGITHDLFPSEMDEKIRAGSLDIVFTTLWTREEAGLRVLMMHLAVANPGGEAEMHPAPPPLPAVPASFSADEREIWDRIEDWFVAIKAQDRDFIEGIHGEHFVCTELHGRRMTRDEHIQLELGASEIDAYVTDLHCRRYGDDVMLSWGRQVLVGAVSTENEAVDAGVRDGIEFAFTIVWERDNGMWRVATLHASLLSEPPTAA